MTSLTRILAVGVAAASGATAAYLGVVTGKVTVDLGVGRRRRPLGPIVVEIDASPEIVFDMVAAPYAERPPRALRDKVQVLDRGEDLVLAAHFTPVHGRLTATTVETVRFERPGLVTFRLVRGPVPEVTETFVLTPDGDGTVLTYEGELGADLWRLGEVWGGIVATSWEAAVRHALATVKSQAERRG